MPTQLGKTRDIGTAIGAGAGIAAAGGFNPISDVLGGTAFLAELFGGGESAAQKQAQQNANQAYGQASYGYGQLGDIGNQQYNQYLAQFPNLMSQFQYASGIPGGQWAPQTSVNQQGLPTSPAQPGGQRIPMTPGRQANVTGPGAANPANVAQPNQPGPYDLTGPQQVQLNQQVGQITHQMQSAIQEYQQQAAQQGMQPNPAAIEQIRQTFASQAEIAKANFAETARQNRQSALASLMATYLGIGQQGQSDISASAGGYAGLAGEQQNQANIQQEIQSQQQAALLQLLGLAAASSKKQNVPTAPAPAPPGGTLNPWWQFINSNLYPPASPPSTIGS